MLPEPTPSMLAAAEKVMHFIDEAWCSPWFKGDPPTNEEAVQMLWAAMKAAYEADHVVPQGPDEL